MFAMSSASSVLSGLALLLAVSLLLTGCPAFSGAPGSGNAVTEKRPVSAFSRVDLIGAAEVEVSLGPVQSVEVTLDDNLLPLIETTVEGGTLRITSTKSYNSSLGLKVKIVVPSLEGFAVSGAANLHAVGLDAKVFSLNISGAGNADLQGGVDLLEVRLSGAGKIRAYDLAAKQVTLNLSGAGDAQVSATESLDATVSGAGSVRYRGHPAQVRQNVSGAGSIQAD
jgi:hypothetical protein